MAYRTELQMGTFRTDLTSDVDRFIHNLPYNPLPCLLRVPVSIV